MSERWRPCYQREFALCERVAASDWMTARTKKRKPCVENACTWPRARVLEDVTVRVWWFFWYEGSAGDRIVGENRVCLWEHYQETLGYLLRCLLALADISIINYIYTLAGGYTKVWSPDRTTRSIATAVECQQLCWESYLGNNVTLYNIYTREGHLPLRLLKHVSSVNGCR